MSDAAQRWDYERSDASPRLIAALAAGIGAALVIIPAALVLLYPRALTEAQAEHVVWQPPQPALQVDPQAELGAQRAAEDARLSTYGWVDRDKGVVRIPIERASALLAARGLNGWPGPRAPAAASDATSDSGRR